MPRSTRMRLVVIGLTVAFGVAGCMHPEEWERWWAQFKDQDTQPTADPRRAPATAALREAIGPLVTIEGLRLNRVRGFGLVVNLIDTGGSDGPEEVKKHLANEMRRRQHIGDPTVPANRILSDRDTAIVEITGLIPAAAEKGTRFDVVVRALGEETRSIEGGNLVLGDLMRYADTPRGVIAGKKLATCKGAVFVSPFGKSEDSPTRLDARTGIVLGGGIVRESRRLRLILTTPSYGVASRMARRLNSRYGGLNPIADAKSPSIVQIKIPPAYRERKKLFLDLAMHTTLRSDRLFLDTRVRDLSREIIHPDAAYEDIALAWEAIGSPAALDAARSFYEHPSATTRYYAGRTGMRLGDAPGMDVVAGFAADDQSVLRHQAIEELGYAARQMHRAGEYLRKLMDDSDVRIRIAAYKALRKVGHPAIHTIRVGDDNVILDVVDSTGPFQIFVQRTLMPRIAVFGSSMTCRPPATYHKRGVLISANHGDRALTIRRTNPRNGRVSPELEGPLNVAELIEYLAGAPVQDSEHRLTGLAVSYSELVDILYSLCETGAIPAFLEIERPRVTDQLGSRRSRQRPESEL